MAKIEINYDLIEKIQQAKGEAKFKRYTKMVINRAKPYMISAVIGYGISGITRLISPEIAIKGILNFTVAPVALTLSLTPLLMQLDNKLTKSTEEQKAEKELTDLSLKLNSQFVKTSLPLLLESNQYHKEHKLVINKKGLPCIMQNKYIMIPTYDDGDITETSILQEHKIGSKKYILSLGSPTQVKQFKPAYGF